LIGLLEHLQRRPPASDAAAAEVCVRELGLVLAEAEEQLD